MFVRRRPVAGLATGMLVGAAIANRGAEARADQQMMMAQQQAQIDQARAEAARAQQQAAQAQAQAQAPVVVAQAQPVTAYAPPPQQQAVATAGVGRQMLGEALGPSDSVEGLLALKKQLNVTQVMCDQALGMYRQSLELTKKAGRSNTTGAVVNVAFRGTGPMDYALDAKRDAETKAALKPAENASAMLIEAFKQVPQELRIRYPAEMARVGDVPVARLKVGSFGKDVLVNAAFGGVGGAMRDVSMAKKIRQNEEELMACMSVVNEQRQLMQVVQARLDGDIERARRSSSAPAVAVAVASAPAPPPPVAMPPPPAINSTPAQQTLQLTAAHIVDEQSLPMQQHQIISVPQGALVTLVRGTLEGGLGAPYQDYIEVQYNGRVGKISRLVVRPVTASVPPPIF